MYDIVHDRKAVYIMKKENTAIRLISFQKVYFHDFLSRNLSRNLSRRWYNIRLFYRISQFICHKKVPRLIAGDFYHTKLIHIPNLLRPIICRMPAGSLIGPAGSVIQKIPVSAAIFRVTGLPIPAMPASTHVSVRVKQIPVVID